MIGVALKVAAFSISFGTSGKRYVRSRLPAKSELFESQSLNFANLQQSSLRDVYRLLERPGHLNGGVE